MRFIHRYKNLNARFVKKICPPKMSAISNDIALIGFKVVLARVRVTPLKMPKCSVKKCKNNTSKALKKMGFFILGNLINTLFIFLKFLFILIRFGIIFKDF